MLNDMFPMKTCLLSSLPTPGQQCLSRSAQIAAANPTPRAPEVLAACAAFFAEAEERFPAEARSARRKLPPGTACALASDAKDCVALCVLGSRGVRSRYTVGIGVG